ncbi:MAG: hypothetical protein JWN72_2435 [Thermoleophilia bacterium]|nr:hypothetical protein [Thermoleophilia bacterium]
MRRATMTGRTMNLNFNAMRGTICTVGGKAFDDISHLLGSKLDDAATAAKAPAAKHSYIASVADDAPVGSGSGTYLGESNTWVDDLGGAIDRSGAGSVDDAGRGLDELGNVSRGGGYDEVSYGGDTYGGDLF